MEDAAPRGDEGMIGTAVLPATAEAVLDPDPAHHPDQFALLGQRRFGPFFWTQFLGAANDNLFKFAFTILVTYQLQLSWLPPELAGLVIGALFILPFLLLSGTSGQLADKHDKARVMRLVKSLEVAIMLVAAVGFLHPDVDVKVPTLLSCVFMMGVHSTLFGPVKYAYLPQHLSDRELTGGNGMVEMGTFVAILLGNVAGGLLIALPRGAVFAALACVAVAVAGRVVAGRIPASPAADPALRINWNPFTETWRNLRVAHADVVVFRSMLGISWMWFFGAVFLSNFPAFAKGVLHGDEHVASLLLVVFSVGIGVGSLLCEVLSRRHVEIGLVPLGAIGMTVFAVDLYWACTRLATPAGLWSVGDFLAQAAHWRVMADLALLAGSAGLYSVPMYALIQLRAQPTHRARVIAANNILNSLFMIVSAVLAGVLLQAGFSIVEIFGLTGLANAAVAFYIFLLVPEYLLRFIALLATRVMYRFRIAGAEHIPEHGAAVVACNHVSYVDAILLMAASPRPIRFLMDHRIFALPVIGGLFRLARAIPVAPQKEDPVQYERAFAEARRVLDEGDLLGIFPEGSITRDGTLQPLKGGIVKVLQANPVPVVPVVLHNLWGSMFSRIEGGALRRPFRRGLFNRVTLLAAPAWPAATVNPDSLHAELSRLLAEAARGQR